MEVRARGSRRPTLAAIAGLATIALVAAGASPAQAVPVKRGHTKLIFNQNTSSGLDTLGIGIFPTPPAEARLGGEQFPISHGTVSRNGRSARIRHDGGIVFVGDNGSVNVRHLEVHLCCSNRNRSDVRALVAGQRMTFLDLVGGVGTAGRRTITYRGIHAFLTRRAARTLNRGLGIGFFNQGTRLGKLRIEMTTGR
jgi:hypothetical protein